jgi:hypothetical protein
MPALQFASAVTGDELFFNVLDESGRGIGSRCMSYSGQSIYTLEVNPHQAAKSLTIQIFISQPLQFEFMVNPADIHPPKP